METKLINFDNYNNALFEAVEVLKSGELVAFPTETVYGLGADGLNPDAILKIFKTKGRKSDNPLILHISDIEMLKKLTIQPLDDIIKITEKYWPGPLTIILKKSKIVPDEITAGLDTVAIRMPDNKFALDLIKNLDKPVAAPSANLSGKPSPTDAATCMKDLDGKIPLIIDGGNTRFGLESTVVDLTKKPYAILRPGAITYEELKDFLGDVEIDSHILGKSETPRAPGQKYTHYAPEASAYLVSGSNSEKIEKIEDFIKENKDIKIGILASEELLKNIENSIEKYNLGLIEDLETYGSLIFRGLRDLDDRKVDVIICEAVDETGLGLAIMNRLKKSTGNKFI